MWTALLCLGLAALASAQPASDLMQSAIFEQETAGNLDSAIRLYQQILGAGPSMRIYAAQAQYRLATCLLRKGDRAGAKAAFDTLIRDYPGEKEWIARARESLAGTGGLLPAPWSDTEVAEYRWNIPNVDDGWSLTRIAPSSRPGNQRIQINFYSPRLYATMVDIDLAEMRPLQATYRPPRNVPGQIPAWHRDSGAARYEYGEVLYLLRRMPLYPGWSESIPVQGPNGATTDLKASVSGVERVTVPAGAFQCLKVLLSMSPKSQPIRYNAAGSDWVVNSAEQWLWFGTEGARPLVKMQVGPYVGELAALRTGEQNGNSTRAQELFDRSLQICGASLPPDHPQTGIILQAYAAFLRNAHRRTEAEVANQRARAILARRAYTVDASSLAAKD